MRRLLKPRIFYGWIIVATLFVVNFATAATGTLNLGLFIIPMSGDLGISRGIFGWLSTCRSLAGGVSSTFLGRLVDRFGSRLLIPLSSLITGLCLIGVGAATRSYQLFLLFSLLGLSGLSTQGGSLISSVPVAKWFVRRRGTALSLASMGLGIGPIVFIPITQLLIDGVGWRRAWMVLAVVSMAIIVPLALAFLRRQPEDMGQQPDGGVQASSRNVHAHPSGEVEAIWTIGEALRTRSFWLVTLSFMLVGFAQGEAVHRIPYWTELGFDARIVSLSFSADAAGAAAMILVAGFLLDRFPPRFVAAGSFAGFAGAVFLMLLATNVLHLFASTVLFGFSVGTNMVCQTYLWARYYGRTFLGTIRGITMPAMLLTTAMGAPFAGYIYDFTGSYGSAWQTAIGLYLLAILVMLLATPPRQRRKAQASP